jgi:hypothetical protein
MVLTYCQQGAYLLTCGDTDIGVAIALGWGLKDVVAETAKAYSKKMKR